MHLQAAWRYFELLVGKNETVSLRVSAAKRLVAHCACYLPITMEPFLFLVCFEKLCLGTIQSEWIRICSNSVDNNLIECSLIEGKPLPKIPTFPDSHRFSVNVSLVRNSDWIVYLLLYTIRSCGPISSRQRVIYQSRLETKRVMCVCMWMGDGRDAATAPDSAVTRL